MEIAKIVSTAILTAICYAVLVEQKKDMAIMVGISGSLIVLLMIVGQIAAVIDALSALALKAGVSNTLFSVVLKIVAIGYVTEFSANICEDCGAKSVADKVQLGGKIAIIVVSLPIITAILEITEAILSV